VIHAGNGEDAGMGKRRVADVLVTDIKLPGPVDGWTIRTLSRACPPTASDLCDWIFAGSGPSSAGQSVLAEALLPGRDHAGREASDDGKPIWIGLR
jgi:hypothetical protein